MVKTLGTSSRYGYIMVSFAVFFVLCCYVTENSMLQKSQGNQLDKHEFSELVKQSSTVEDLGAGHAKAAQVQGLCFSRYPYEDKNKYIKRKSG
jgi:hypothetical protein